MKYDYLIVGAGLFGATFAHLAKKVGKTCIVIDQRNHIGGNLYCKKMHGITVHMYGPHIFHTNDKRVYDFVTSLVNVHPYCHQPIAMYNDTLYNLPFNMNTFYQMWGVKSAQEAKNIINKQSQTISNTPSLRNKAISMVGTDIYHKLIEGYTEKQWGEKCENLPASIIKRIPVRYTFDDRYFSDLYEFIPDKGYNTLFEKLLENITVLKCLPIIKDTKAEIPNYVYDCHTRLGRMRGKTTKMFIEEEQRALFPKEAGLFDNCKWDKFLDMLNSGFDNTMSAPPKPTKEAIGELMNGVVQKDLFS